MAVVALTAGRKRLIGWLAAGPRPASGLLSAVRKKVGCRARAVLRFLTAVGTLAQEQHPRAFGRASRCIFRANDPSAE